MSGHHHHDSGQGHENPHAGQGPVLVDVDSEHGALILMAPPELTGAEIEVSRRLPAGGHGPRTHVAVLARQVGGRQVQAAVYPSLPVGAWSLWSPDDDSVVLTVEVLPGRVVTAQWPAAASGRRTPELLAG